MKNWIRAGRRLPDAGVAAIAPLSAAALAAIVVVLSSPAPAGESDDQLARTLIDRFYQDLGPASAELDAFMGDGFQIIGPMAFASTSRAT